MSATTNGSQDDEPSQDGSTSDEGQRHWLTNDVAYLGVLASYMGVWSFVHISPRLSPSCGLDAGAVLALGIAATWGFGPKAVETWEKVKGDG